MRSFTPTENPTVVTDHRMILSVSKEQSTLYEPISRSLFFGIPTATMRMTRMRADLAHADSACKEAFACATTARPPRRRGHPPGSAWAAASSRLTS